MVRKHPAACPNMHIHFPLAMLILKYITYLNNPHTNKATIKIINI
jgi:hypothetical protein